MQSKTPAEIIPAPVMRSATPQEKELVRLADVAEKLRLRAARAYQTTHLNLSIPGRNDPWSYTFIEARGWVVAAEQPHPYQVELVRVRGPINHDQQISTMGFSTDADEKLRQAIAQAEGEGRTRLTIRLVA